MKKYAIILVITFQTLNCLGQIGINKDSKNNMVVKSHDDFMQLRIEENTYTFGWLNSVFSGIPCMRDYRKIKVTYYDSTGMEVNEPEPQSLKVITEQVLLDTLNNAITIEGYALGGWYGAGSNIQIFIGQRVDTISPLYSPILDSNRNTDKKPILLGYFPSFYLRDFTQFTSEIGFKSHKQRAFKLTI